MTHAGCSITVLRKAIGEHSSEYILVCRPSFAWVCLGGASELSHAALSRRPCDVTGLLERPPFAASALPREFGRASSAMPFALPKLCDDPWQM